MERTYQKQLCSKALYAAIAAFFALAFAAIALPGAAWAETLAPGSADEGSSGDAAANPLAELRFTYDEEGLYEYPMTPEFSPEVREYTIEVPDNFSNKQNSSDMYVWACVSSGLNKDNMEVMAYYKYVWPPIGQECELPIAPDGSVGSYMEKALRGQKPIEDYSVKVLSETYTIHVKKSPMINAVKNNATNKNYSVTPTFTTATVYALESRSAEVDLYINPDENLDITFSTVPSSASVIVDGYDPVGNKKYSIKPEWDSNRSFDVNITVPDNEDAHGLSYVMHVKQKPSSLEIVNPPNKTVYRGGEKFNPAGMVVKATYENGDVELLEPGDYTIDPSRGLLPSDNAITITVTSLSIEQPITVKPMELQGAGTEADPYLVESADDMAYLSGLSQAGMSFRGEYIKMINDITLPDNWVPLGAGYDWKPRQANTETARFEGTFDGDGHLLTIPEGGRPLLGYAGYAMVKNLNIYGPKIEGNGVLENYVVDYTLGGYPPCDFVNITLKRGTKTLKSGILGGYASGLNQCAIRFCTIEEGVEIGYTGEEDWVGGFAGEFNGEIIGCVNHGTVRGRNFVGGIVADKGQTMGEFKVYDCVFDGVVEASGNYVGGICGAGYGGTKFGWASAPNTPCVTIRNCMATGSVTGSNYIGGILGADPCVKCTFGNYIGYIQSNYFGGALVATTSDEAKYVGGIIGFWDSMNNCTIFGDNYWLEGCGAEAGIGHVARVITKDGLTEEELNSTSHNLENWYGREDGLTPENASERFTVKVSAAQVADGTLVKLMNSAVNTSGTWSQQGDAVALGIGVRAFEMGALGQQGRSDYADAVKALAANTKGFRSGSYAVLSADWLDGKDLILFKSDGTLESVPANQAKLTGDLSFTGYRTIDLTYENLTFSTHIRVANPIINQEAVDAAIAEIEALPAVDEVTAESAAAAEKARAAFDALGKGEQPLVTNAAKLPEVEAAVDAAVALVEATEAAKAYEDAAVAAANAAVAAETAKAAAAEAAKTPGEAAVKAAQDAEAAAQNALDLAKAAEKAAAAAVEAAAKAQELAVTEAGKAAAKGAVDAADEAKTAAGQAATDAATAVEKAGAAIKAAQAAAGKAAADKAAKLAAANNINTASVKAAQVKAASNLGATTITLGPKVKKIAKGAFKGTKIKTIIVKSKKLKKKSVKGSLKGSKVKTVKVQIGKKKVNKKYVKKYKKIFTKKNAGKKAKVK